MKPRVLASAVTAIVIASGLLTHGQQGTAAADSTGRLMRVPRAGDFTVDGRGTAAAWSRAEWQPLQPRAAAERAYPTRVKMLYSATGLYVLMDGEDRKLTATLDDDFLDLWNEDVFEFFLWPDERFPVYFEYEISPLGHELPILVPNLGGPFYGWRPWHYEAARKTQKAASVRGGEARSGASITGWMAEVYVPYDLLKPLQNVPPQSGAKWRANFYRMDYDDGRSVSWNWAPLQGTFHQPEKFGTLLFE